MSKLHDHADFKGQMIALGVVLAALCLIGLVIALVVVTYLNGSQDVGAVLGALA